jgi:hypothetical protein
VGERPHPAPSPEWESGRAASPCPIPRVGEREKRAGGRRGVTHSSIRPFGLGEGREVSPIPPFSHSGRERGREVSPILPLFYHPIFTTGE